MSLDPWEKQDNESDDAWALFVVYRDMFPRNPKALVGNVMYKGKLDVSISTIYKTSKEWKWRERVLAYDRHTDAEVRAHRQMALSESLEEMTARHIQLLQLGDEWAHNEMVKHLKEAQSGSTSKSKVADIVAYMKMSIEKGRLIKGEVTERTENVSNVFAKMPVDELEKLETRLRELEEDADLEELPPEKQRRISGQTGT